MAHWVIRAQRNLQRSPRVIIECEEPIIPFRFSNKCFRREARPPHGTKAHYLFPHRLTYPGGFHLCDYLLS